MVSKARKLSFRKTLAASVVATAALAFGTGKRDFFYEYEPAIQDTHLLRSAGQEIKYIPPGKSESVKIDLGVDNSKSPASGEYARRFALDPAALQISEQNIDDAARSIRQLPNVAVVRVAGLSSAEDDKMTKGERTGGFQTSSRDNLDLAIVRGYVATAMLQKRLEQLGSSIKVVYAGGIENSLSDEEYKQLRDLIAPNIKDDLEANIKITNVVNKYNLDNQGVGHTVRALLDELLAKRRGAQIDADFYPNGTSQTSTNGTCMTYNKVDSVTILGKPAKGIILPYVIPVLIPWFRKKREDEIQQDSGTRHKSFLGKIRDRKDNVFRNFFNNYPELDEQRDRILNTCPSSEDVTIQISRSRTLRGKRIALPVRLKVIDSLRYRINTDSLLGRPVVRMHNKLFSEALKHEATALVDHTRSHRALRKIGPVIVIVPFLALTIAAMKPLYYGPGVDDQGCETVGLMPRPGIVTKTPEECDTDRGANKPTKPEVGLDLPTMDAQSCLTKHPEAKLDEQKIPNSNFVIGR